MADSAKICLCGLKNTVFTIKIAENICNVVYLQITFQMNGLHFMLIRAGR
jgi:hypothetical protein